MRETHLLWQGTTLNGKYRVERVLGEGGFGITYLAFDTIMNEYVAIKEFFPSVYVTRDTSDGETKYITVISSSKQSQYDKGLQRFEEEASRLAMFNKEPGIVSVKNFFKENNTGYMVMEYIDGVSLKQYLTQQGGHLSWEQIYHMMQPVMNSLSILHKDGMIHRDISPDNIMVTKDGNIKLIDFGAARYVGNEDEKSLTVILKSGYAPIEQYSSEGVQGPWTDVYALAATMSKMLTGVTPPESVARKAGIEKIDHIEGVPSHISKAIMKGMQIESKDRCKSIEEFRDSIEKNKRRTNISWVIGGGILITAACCIFLFINSIGGKKEIEATNEKEMTTESTMVEQMIEPTEVPEDNPIENNEDEQVDIAEEVEDEAIPEEELIETKMREPQDVICVAATSMYFANGKHGIYAGKEFGDGIWKENYKVLSKEDGYNSELLIHEGTVLHNAVPADDNLTMWEIDNPGGVYYWDGAYNEVINQWGFLEHEYIYTEYTGEKIYVKNMIPVDQLDNYRSMATLVQNQTDFYEDIKGDVYTDGQNKTQAYRDFDKDGEYELIYAPFGGEKFYYVDGKNVYCADNVSNYVYDEPGVWQYQYGKTSLVHVTFPYYASSCSSFIEMNDSGISSVSITGFNDSMEWLGFDAAYPYSRVKVFSSSGEPGYLYLSSKNVYPVWYLNQKFGECASVEIKMEDFMTVKEADAILKEAAQAILSIDEVIFAGNGGDSLYMKTKGYEISSILYNEVSGFVINYVIDSEMTKINAGKADTFYDAVDISDNPYSESRPTDENGQEKQMDIDKITAHVYVAHDGTDYKISGYSVGEIMPTLGTMEVLVESDFSHFKNK